MYLAVADLEFHAGVQLALAGIAQPVFCAEIELPNPIHTRRQAGGIECGAIGIAAHRVHLDRGIRPRLPTR